jgi:hypothetical protein
MLKWSSQQTLRHQPLPATCRRKQDFSDRSAAAEAKAAAETLSVPDFSDSGPVSEEPFSFKACSEVSREVLVGTGETTSPRFKEDFSTLEAVEGADMDVEVDIPEAVVIQEATQVNILSEGALVADILREVASEEVIQVPILTREGLVEVILKGAASEEAILANIPVDLEVDTKDNSVEATHKGVALEAGIPEATQEVTPVATQAVPEVSATEVRTNRSSSEVQARQEVFLPVEKRSPKEVQSRLVNDVNDVNDVK